MKKHVVELARQAGFVFWENETTKPKDATIDWGACDYDQELEKFYDLARRPAMSNMNASTKKKGGLSNKVNRVDFFRYIRPIDPKTGDVDSQKGVCFYIDMNYSNQVISVSTSVCNGDNFDKEIARNTARHRYHHTDNWFSFRLRDFTESKMSLVEFIVAAMPDRFSAKQAILKQLSMC